MYVLIIVVHLGFNIDKLINCDVNIVTYKKLNKQGKLVFSDSDRNMFDGFMKCLKVPNTKICDICNYKNKCFRRCGKCNNKICIDCFKSHNNNYINSCPYCRYNMSDHWYETNIVLN